MEQTFKNKLEEIEVNIFKKRVISLLNEFNDTEAYHIDYLSKREYVDNEPFLKSIKLIFKNQEYITVNSLNNNPIDKYYFKQLCDNITRILVLSGETDINNNILNILLHKRSKYGKLKELDTFGYIAIIIKSTDKYNALSNIKDYSDLNNKSKIIETAYDYLGYLILLLESIPNISNEIYLREFNKFSNYNSTQQDNEFECRINNIVNSLFIESSHKIEYERDTLIELINTEYEAGIKDTKFNNKMISLYCIILYRNICNLYIQEYKVSYKDLSKKIKDTLISRNEQYNSSFHKQFVKFGIVSALLRLSNKHIRLLNQFKNGDNFEDTILDYLGYIVLIYNEFQ